MLINNQYVVPYIKFSFKIYLLLFTPIGNLHQSDEEKVLNFSTLLESIKRIVIKLGTSFILALCGNPAQCGMRGNHEPL
jgi:hypothetical protein